MAEDHPADDVMAMAYRAIQPWMGLNDKMAAHDCATAVAKVIIEYGEQRAREAIEELRKTCADIFGQGDDWPAHGNAPLAIAAALQLRVTAAREARAAAIEEAARLCDDAVAQARYLQGQQERRTWSQSVDRNVARLGVRIVAATELGGRIRGLADTHPAHVVCRSSRTSP